MSRVGRRRLTLRTFRTLGLAVLTQVGTDTTYALSLLGYATAGRALGEEWAEVGVLLLLLTPFMIGQFAVAPLSQTLNAVGWNAQQLAWDVARLLVTAAAFLPVLAGWFGMRSGVALFSVAMVGVYGAHVLLSRGALRQVAERAEESRVAEPALTVERGDPARAMA